MKAKITEVFESIQGEGIYVGEKQLFVRFYDCNLSCSYCDTKPNAYTEYTPQELFEELTLYSGRYHAIAFTGGEPLLQKDFLKGFLPLTKSAGYKNYLETNGTLPDELSEVIGNVDIVAMDFKLPSVTGGKDFWEEHREFLRIASQKEVFVKLVVNTNADDYEVYKALGIVRKINPAAIVVIQPQSQVKGRALDRKLDWWRAVCKQEEVAACVIPQVHKSAGVR
ncbi:MAG: 7-carboxy-7-deazaguanine synthase QueE [Candidatus Omnitrophica bacterium]|nr:7-carboxy-7-deazaguanine synthase QueE [Candidatus Omnitrophota bacterium]